MKPFICCASLFLGLSSVGVLSAAPDERVQKMLADWKERQERYKVVRYELSGTVEEADTPIPEHLKGRVVRPQGPNTYPVKAVVQIDFTRNRLRIEETNRSPSRDGTKWIARHRVSTFDGKTYQTSLPRDRNEQAENDPDVVIVKGNLSNTGIEWYLWPVLLGHGIVPLPQSPSRVDRLPRTHEPEDFGISSMVQHDGRSHTAVKSELVGNATYEIWTDSARGSAVARLVRWDVKSPSSRLDIRYKQADGWLPESWSYTSTSGGKTGAVVKMRVDSVQIDVPLNDSDYALPLRPGMLVSEMEYPPSGSGLDPVRASQRTYRVVEDGSESQVGEAKGFVTTDGVQLPHNSARNWTQLIGLVVLVIFGVGCCIWLVRRQLRRRSSQA